MKFVITKQYQFCDDSEIDDSSNNSINPAINNNVNQTIRNYYITFIAGDYSLVLVPRIQSI